jgi:DNA-binding transcriptional MerR regulator
MADGGHLRIGELSRRSGVSPELLRAWERRYGLLEPSRSSGGLRLYSHEDLARVQAMRQHLAAGLAAAEAATMARQGAEAADSYRRPEGALRQLERALSRFDEGAVHMVMDTLLARLSLDTILQEVVVPYLHDLGERWERGEASVAQEHFASSLLRGRLLGLARGWGRGLGPRAMLACAPGEQHDLGLIAFGLALRDRGWRIVYLGPDTPLESIADAARLSRPASVVVSSVDAHAFRRHAESLTELAGDYRLFLGGAGAAQAHLDTRVTTLTGGPVEEAERLALLAHP